MHLRSDYRLRESENVILRLSSKQKHHSKNSYNFQKSNEEYRKNVTGIGKEIMIVRDSHVKCIKRLNGQTQIIGKIR